MKLLLCLIPCPLTRHTHRSAWKNRLNQEDAELVHKSTECLGSAAIIFKVAVILTHTRKRHFVQSWVSKLRTQQIGFPLSIQSGAVKLVLWRHWMHATQVHPVTAENQFHCTRLYILTLLFSVLPYLPSYRYLLFVGQCKTQTDRFSNDSLSQSYSCLHKLNSLPL